MSACTQSIPGTLKAFDSILIPLFADFILIAPEVLFNFLFLDCSAQQNGSQETKLYFYGILQAQFNSVRDLK